VSDYLTLSERVASFLDDERPSGLMLDTAQVTALAVAATTFYHGFARMGAAWDALEADPDTDPDQAIDAETALSDSEWALIRPLFLLYIERETAMMLEASRGLGVDVFGRSTSEVATDITLAEQEMSKRAFFHPALCVI